MTYHIGDTITDSQFNKTGKIYQVDDYESCVVIYVEWEDGSKSDFTPDKTTSLAS